MQILTATDQGLALDDRGLAYGDGLFETVRVCHGRPELALAHQQRMLAGARRLGIPLTPEDYQRGLSQALEHCQHPQAVIKLILTRGSGGRGYRPPEAASPRMIVSVHGLPPLPDPAVGVKACVSAIPLVVNPVLAGLKTLNRLEQVMASQSMPDDCYEALMLNLQGELVEGTRCNLLFRWRGHWYTPALASVAVAGVMLGYVRQRLATAGIGVEERPLTPAMLASPDFEGLLLTNSVMGVIPVHTLDSLRLPLPEELATIHHLTDPPLEDI
ncbi:aminodeoxychorismate lyase [uncultured Marinobacter sp.]|uniref:aminodeoxychorismate lyase n=1 Tax=uncultured Marinobacter sp. TaxID=187379 RepID=UPI0030DC7F57